LIALQRWSQPAVRKAAIETLARNYKDRKPYAGTWWGTQPARHGPPKRDVAWEGTPIVRDAVVKALGDSAAEVRKAAVAALVEWADPETLPPLRERFAAEKDPANRLDLVRAVAGMKTPAAADFLAGVLGDRSFPLIIREVALVGLSDTGAATADRAVALVANGGEPVELHAKALIALAGLRSSRTLATCDASLKTTRHVLVINSALEAMIRYGDPAAGPLVMREMTNEIADVRQTAALAAGKLRLRAAIPDLIRLSRDTWTDFNSTMALAQMPDARALPAYLTGLTSKNATLRTASRNALIRIREAVAPTLEELAKRNELPPGVISELREVYGSYVPVTAWKLIGPFEGREKAYPPETEQKFDAVYEGVEKKVRWREGHGDPKTGRVNLVGRFSSSENVCAYGFAEIGSDRDRDAKLRIGSDDTLTVWLSGTKVYEFAESRGWAQDQATVPVHLVKGANRLLIKCGNYGGPWEFSVAVSGDVDRYAFLHGGPAKFDLDEFRKFARQTPGDPERGNKLFQDVKGLACVKCHAVEGKGGLVGPDLAGIAVKYNREDLMTSVLEPSKVIAQGYETVNVYTKGGKTLIGVFKGETADAVRLADAEGMEHVISKSNIEEKSFSPVSVMPNGLSDGMTLQDFADVIAFLEARKEKK
jgi:putative heme-binding domain-containing protein